MFQHDLECSGIVTTLYLDAIPETSVQLLFGSTEIEIEIEIKRLYVLLSNKRNPVKNN